MAGLSTVEREIEEVLENRQDKTMPEVIAIMKEVDGGRWSGNHQVEVANWLKTRMQEENRRKETSRRKNPAKDRDHQNTLRVKNWLSDA